MRRTNGALHRVGRWVGIAIAVVVMGSTEICARVVVPVESRPARIDRFALADVGAGAYVHRRDALAGTWLEVVGERVRTRLSRRNEGISAIEVSRRPAPGTSRVVVLGGSTTRGVPYDHRGGGFVAELRSDTGHAWEVINLGVPGMDARGVADMAREARLLEPDLFVVYTGNNEVIGDVLDQCVRSARIWVARTLDNLVVYRLIRSALLPPPTVAGSADALAAQERCMNERVAEAWAGGLAQLGPPIDPVRAAGVRLPAERSDPVTETVRTRLMEALDAVALQAGDVGADVILVKPAVNLRAPPERALGGPGSDVATARAVDAWIARTDQEGVSAWTGALAVDPHRADALHGWGMARLAEEPTASAVTLALRAAVDQDYLSRRPTQSVLRTMDVACDRWDHMTCLDAGAGLAEQAGTAVLPQEWFFDHCHPSEEGNARIARMVSVAVGDALARRSEED